MIVDNTYDIPPDEAQLFGSAIGVAQYVSECVSEQVNSISSGEIGLNVYVKIFPHGQPANG